MVKVTSGMNDIEGGDGGQLMFQVVECDDLDAARRGLMLAGQRVSKIPHPEEPSEGLASFVSDLEERPEGPLIWFDIADVEELDVLEQVTDAVVMALTEVGVTSGRLTRPSLG